MCSIFTDLFNAADENKDGSMSMGELLDIASPDVDNDANIDANERRMGKRTARIWIALILDYDDTHIDAPILSDNRISLKELNAFTHSEFPGKNLFVAGSYDADGYLVSKPGRSTVLLQRADAILEVL